MQVNRTNPNQIVITGIEDEKSQSNGVGSIIHILSEQFRHLFQYRELIRNLVIRDLKVRYKS